MQTIIPPLSQLITSSHSSEPAEFSKHGVLTTRSHSDSWRIFSSPRLSDTGMIETNFRGEPPLCSGHFSRSIRKNRRLKYIRMIEEETKEESRLQERLIWLIRRIGTQRVSEVLSEQLPNSFPVIEGSAKNTVVLERPRRDGCSRSGTPLSEEQRASRRNMQKRESKRRLFKYYQDQLNAIRQNMLKLREATRICEILFDQMIERNIHRLKQSGQEIRKDLFGSEYVAQPQGTRSSTFSLHVEGDGEGTVHQNYTAR
ncbi:hypothetical protein Gasu2_41570 [Galdieria sulphuraria]|nr:hypothetical protein Gasu2_41570 [Galdieria sulphuraria]